VGLLALLDYSRDEPATALPTQQGRTSIELMATAPAAPAPEPEQKEDIEFFAVTDVTAKVEAPLDAEEPPPETTAPMAEQAPPDVQDHTLAEVTVPVLAVRTEREVVRRPADRPSIAENSPQLPPRKPSPPKIPPAETIAEATLASVASVAREGTESDEPPRAQSNPAPIYPAEAIASLQEGKVVLRARIDTAGRVESLRVLASSGFTLLDDAALTAVRRWRFNPARRGGQPIATEVNIPVRFSIRDI
jgi:protein TonB